MAFSLPNIKELVTKGAETFQRFPLALLSSIVATLIVIYFIEYEPRELKGMDLILAKIATSAMLGVFVFTALRLIEYRPRYMGQVLLSGIGILGLVAYYFSLPDDTGVFDAWIYLLRHIFLIILFFVSILWTPFIKSHLPNVDYWQYAKEVLFSLVMTVLFSIVVIVGVNTAVYAVEKLFDLYIRGKYYFMLDTLIVGVFSIAYFLSQTPHDPLSSKATPQPPRVEKFFTQYILTPLTGLYFVILYVYTAKLLVTMDWPKGILAWLIVAFSVVAVLTYLFWTHFTTDQRSSWRKWIWLAILVQTVMLFVAIGMRIEAYSWTENRYMVLLLGIWLAGVSLYFLFFKEAKIKWIFISLSLLIGISQIGAFSAYSVSKDAQTNRLKTQLENLKKVENAQLAPVQVRYEISDGIQYLHNRYGAKVLESIFPQITLAYKKLDERARKVEKNLHDKMKLETKHSKVVVAATKRGYKKVQDVFKDKPRFLPHFITHELGFKFMNIWDLNNERNGKIQNINFSTVGSGSKGMRAREIRGYEYISHYYVNWNENSNRVVSRPRWYLQNIDVEIRFEDGIVQIHKDGISLDFNIHDYIDTLVEDHGVNSRRLTQKELTLEKENDTLKVRIEFQHLNKNNYANHKSINFNATVLFKLKGEK